MEVVDLKDSIQEVRHFMYCSRQRKELSELYNKHVIKGKRKGFQDKNFEEFLANKTEVEKIQEAYERGKKDANKELEELKKKIKEIGM